MYTTRDLEVGSPAATESEDLNPSLLDKPAFVMSFPFTFTAREANNVWMEELDDGKRTVDPRNAFKQFLEVYHFMAAESLVYLLPSPSSCELQDLVFTANLGIVLDHLPGKNTAIVSNFSSEPRMNESALGVSFFESMGYKTHVAPHKFEGEAELKHLYDNVYIGGYGIRSERQGYDWMEEKFDMKIIKLKETDPYLYHLDCSIFPLTPEKTLVCTEMFEKEEIDAIEKYTEVVDISVDVAFSGACNSVRLANTLLNSSHIHDLKAGTEEYKTELLKNRALEDIAAETGFELNLFNLSEYHKGGALLSCMVLHLNRHSYSISLL